MVHYGVAPSPVQMNLKVINVPYGMQRSTGIPSIGHFGTGAKMSWGLSVRLRHGRINFMAKARF